MDTTDIDNELVYCVLDQPYSLDEYEAVSFFLAVTSRHIDHLFVGGDKFKINIVCVKIPVNDPDLLIFPFEGGGQWYVNKVIEKESIDIDVPFIRNCFQDGMFDSKNLIFFWAIENRNSDVTNLLLENKICQHDLFKAGLKSIRYGLDKIFKQILKNLENNWNYKQISDYIRHFIQFTNSYKQWDLFYFLMEKYDCPSAYNGILKTAARRGHLDIIRLIFNKSINMTLDSNSALSAAAKCGRLHIVKFFIRKWCRLT